MHPSASFDTVLACHASAGSGRTVLTRRVNGGFQERYYPVHKRMVSSRRTAMATDLYDIRSLLSDEERLAQDNTRAFVESRILPIIARHFEDGTFPNELIPEFGRLGLLGASLPQKYGCAGISDVAYGLIMQELERGDSGIRSFCSVQGSLVMYPIYAFGSEAQKERYLPKMARGEVIGCFGLTEPDFGSNPAGMITRAERVAGGFRDQRRQALDHERQHRPAGDRVGQAGRQDPRLSRADQHEGLPEPRRSSESSRSARRSRAS